MHFILIVFCHASTLTGYTVNEFNEGVVHQRHLVYRNDVVKVCYNAQGHVLLLTGENRRLRQQQLCILLLIHSGGCYFVKGRKLRSISQARFSRTTQGK